MGELIIFISLSIIGGIIASYFVSKSDFPTITGLIVLGIGISLIPFVRNLVTTYNLFFQIILEISVSLLLFETGLEIIYLHGNKKIILASLLQSTLTFSIIFLVMQTIFNIGFLESIVISTIWMVTGSDIAITLLKNMPMESSLKIQIGTMIVIDDLIGEIFFFISFPLLRFNYVFQQNFYLVLKGILEEVLLSIILGIFLGYVIHKFFKFAHNKLPQVISSFAFILLVVGLSEYLNLHSIVVALISGIVFTLSSKFEVVKKVRLSLREFDQLFYTLFIIFSIAYVGLPKIEHYLFAGLVILLIRFIGKSAGAFFVQSTKLIDLESFSDLLIPMLPQSILSAYFAYLARDYLSIFGGSVFAVAIASIILFEVVGYYLIKKIALNKEH